MPDFTGTITIDGKGSFRYTLEKIGAGASGPVDVSGIVPPNGGQQRQVTDSNGDSVATVMLLKHEMKSGMGKNQKPYEMHSFFASDNRKYQTFRAETVARLSPLVGAGTPVKIKAKANNYKSFDIIEIVGS